MVSSHYYVFCMWSGLTVGIAKNLIRKLLVYDPKLRCCALGAMKHQWIQQDINRLEELYKDVTK